MTGLLAIIVLHLPWVPQAEPTTLTFGWPADGQAEVFERAFKKGNRASTRYGLRWSPLEDEDGILVQYTDFRFVTINGMDATEPAIAKALAQATAISSAIPKMRIDLRGNIVGFDDLEKMLDEILPMLRGGLEGAEFEAIGQMLRQPEMQQMITTKTAETWNYWVGHWIDVEFSRGEEEVWKLDMEQTGGVLPEVHISYGERTLYRGVECLEITMTGKSDEKVLLRRVLEMMGTMVDSVDADGPDEWPITRAAKTLTVNGIYAVKGLRPLEVHTSDDTRIWERGSDTPGGQVEEHSYYFDWPGIEPHGES